MKVCPTGASHKLADGTVQVDKEKCIGCQFCAMSCPYGVRYLNETERVVEKCTLCEQKIAQGELPQCVAQCGGRARFFGDLEPVSYTHLDVYKRQSPARGPKAQPARMKAKVRTRVDENRWQRAAVMIHMNRPKHESAA